jgi:tungstate transport system permease protein
MSIIFEGIKKGFLLVITADTEVIRILILSLVVSGSAVFISLFLGIPAGVLLAMKDFPGKKIIISLINTGMGLPPVVVGLFVTVFLWRSGPMGFLKLLYTPQAMVIAQVIIAFPIVAGLSMSAIQQLDRNIYIQTLAMGASKWQVFVVMLKEARLPLLAAVMAGFGGVISEVGSVMMVGGNIKNQTRVLTTAIVMETNKGNFDIAFALAGILLLITFMVNLILTLIQQKENFR